MEEQSTPFPPLPKTYHILPESVDLAIPGFTKQTDPNAKTLALAKRDCSEWYHGFIDRLVRASGREFLPVCRMSDGEFKFVLGEQPPDKRLPRVKKIRFNLKRMQTRLKARPFEAFTEGHYHSGKYSLAERRKILSDYSDMMRQISFRGIIALHLSYGSMFFQERFFPALGKWLADSKIILNDDNYYPFYFVYAALTGGRRGEILKNRRILVVNGSEGEKRKKIERGLMREGASDVLWCPISPTRSLFDRPDFEPFAGKADIAMVGAGIGKPNILARMAPLNIPCIDAGYVFEVWADMRTGRNRAFCVPDS